MAPIEDEIAFEITPESYAETCKGYITVEEAQQILTDLGQNVPPLYDRTLFDLALKDVEKIKPSVIKEFYRLAEQYLKTI